MARNISYGTAVSGSDGITSLNSSSTLTSGYIWYLIDNTTDLAIDRMQSGSVRLNGGQYNDQARIYVVASYDGSTWPDVFSETPGAATITSAGVRDSFCKLAWNIRVETSVSTKHQFSFSIAELYGGIVPKKCVVFVTHSMTAAALHSTGSDHTWYDIPVFEDIT